MFNFKSIASALTIASIAALNAIAPVSANGMHGADVGDSMKFVGCVASSSSLYNGIYNADNTVTLPADQLDVWFADNATITVEVPVTWDLTETMDQECLDQIIANGNIVLQAWGLNTYNNGNAELTITSTSNTNIPITTLVGSDVMTVTLTANSDNNKFEFLDTSLYFYTHVVGNMTFTTTSF